MRGLVDGATSDSPNPATRHSLLERPETTNTGQTPLRHSEAKCRFKREKEGRLQTADQGRKSVKVNVAKKVKQAV